MTSIIAADNKTISWKNWTEEKIVSLFRTFGENFCARTDVCDNNRSTQPTLSNSSELAPCCEDCYCDDDCENYNDCCFKSVYSTEQNEDEECLYQSSDQNIDIVNAKNENNHRKIHCPVGQERNPQGECINALTKWPSQEVGLFVKLLISEPIRLPNGTTAEGIKQFFNGIDFHIETSMGFQLLAEYAHYITDYYIIAFLVTETFQIE
ncbi:hypothetical protein DPMN_014287 [Dreissena polymorpha]|uniref:Uncharacterized protein n=1 Tax=Dreissena polymorpha TaxID=45954 RepID=A0A9D4N9G3_DREPO|nr:hypothetical protein DPMN_014287 [Dreissena polymorpha]